jgi:transcriptional regulator with XRE-family HTH domain
VATRPRNERRLLGEFGRRVRERRLALGLSQEKLAELAGVHRTYMSEIERGERNVALINISRVARALRLDAGDLLRGL